MKNPIGKAIGWPLHDDFKVSGDFKLNIGVPKPTFQTTAPVNHEDYNHTFEHNIFPKNIALHCATANDKFVD